MPDSPEIRYSDGSVKRGEMLSARDLPPLTLDGADLTFIAVNFQTRLRFDDTEVVIETPFRLTVGDEQRTLDPEARQDLGPLLAIYPATVASATIDGALTLRLSFTNGSVIEVPQDSSYEAWSVAGPGSRLIVCPPEGSGLVSVWR